METLNADVDTWVKGGSTTDYSGNAVMRVKNENDGSQNARKAYMRFDLASLGFDHTTDLDTASLELNFVDINLGSGGTSSDATFNVYGLNDADAGELWNQNAITWGNAPANNTGSGFLMGANATLLGQFILNGRTGMIDFTGGTAVADFISQSASNDAVTFMVTRVTTQGALNGSYVHGIASSESGNGPKLVLTPQSGAIPEPATMCALGMAIAGLGGYVRKRRRA